ncbi:MAG: 2-phospho-L-lactate transferase [Chloroflexi bacterium]|nr:2-phospho-L-lactate transferase [Chloroflexota bacterium]
MITCLCGGVGGSKLVLGLYRVAPPRHLRIIVNTADDLELYGLHVSPDLDTVTYTLAGIARRDVGWGIEGDTFGALEMLDRYGAPTWFQVGDRDLATHLYRTGGLRGGRRLTEVTQDIARHLGVRATLLPMTDGRVSTRLLVAGEWLEFQDYFVRRGHRDRVEGVRLDGVEQALPTAEVLDAIASAEVVVLVNSNPVLSILPILALPQMRDALRRSSAARVAVSPFVGSAAFSGPAGELMGLIGCAARARDLAEVYRDVVDGVVIDSADSDQVPAIEALGVRALCTDIRMRDDADRERLAAEALAFARGVR